MQGCGLALGAIPCCTVQCGDALELMARLPANSIDLIVTDPPYFKVKNEPWDRQWDKPERFIDWIGRLCAEWQRILKPNGSVYCFASPGMAARIELQISRFFHVLNHLVWRKERGRQNQAAKEILRAFFGGSERIIFAEHFGADNMAKGEAGYAAKCDELRGFVFESLRAYLDGERKRAGIEKEECNEACGFSRSAGGMASRHYFSRSQWCLPTAQHYAALQALFNRNAQNKPEYLRREYEDLRREYEDLRRPFSVTADVPYTDVWDFPTVAHYPGKHPCEKPLAMIEHIVRVSSRPGSMVFDPFLGSGTTAVAARKLGRHFLGFDISAEYCANAERRLAERVKPAQQMELVADA